MKLEDQVCSLELAKRLKELGVKQDSLFCWCLYQIESDSKPWWKLFLTEHSLNVTSATAAFTVAEMGEMLPRGFKSGSNNYDWFCGVYNQPLTYSNTEADARAKILIYLLENKLVKGEEAKV